MEDLIRRSTNAILLAVFVLFVCTQALIIAYGSKLSRFTDTITCYTTEDILYLEGSRVFTESGRIDITFRSRNLAITYFEQLSADIANGEY